MSATKTKYISTTRYSFSAATATARVKIVKEFSVIVGIVQLEMTELDLN